MGQGSPGAARQAWPVAPAQVDRPHLIFPDVLRLHLLQVPEQRPGLPSHWWRDALGHPSAHLWGRSSPETDAGTTPGRRRSKRPVEDAAEGQGLPRAGSDLPKLGVENSPDCSLPVGSWAGLAAALAGIRVSRALWGPKASALQGQDTQLCTFVLLWYFCQFLSFFTHLSAPRRSWAFC